MSFRLSEEEYDSLKDLSISNGSRSVSDFTRSMAFQHNNHEDLNNIIKALEDKLERLTEILEKRDEK